MKLDITYLCICLVLNVRVYPSVPNANSLQILDIDRVALQDDLSSGRDIVPSCKGGRKGEGGEGGREGEGGGREGGRGREIQ